MKYRATSKNRFIAVFLVLVLSAGLVACGGNNSNKSGPEGVFENTKVDEDDGQGFKPIDEYSSLGNLTFNADGTGRWEYALENDIEWKLKGDKLTIVEKWEDSDYGDQEETYKASWDGEEVVIDVWGYKYLFEKTGDSALAKDKEDSDLAEETSSASDANVDPALVGAYKGIGSEMQGTEFEASGEWLNLEADGTGKWFLGVTEDTFVWSTSGSNINFDVDVEGSDIKMPYTASIEGEEIILDTGMLYSFIKEDRAADSLADKPEETTLAPAEDNVATGYVGWGYKTLGQITIPCDWYGVLQLTNCEGFDFEEKDYDVWGYTDETSSGDAYFEIWPNSKLEGDPFISFYIDREETEWLTPIITDGDGFVDLDGGSSGVYQVLTEDDEWALLSQYIDGALDIYHGYYDDEGRYADCRFFVREKGTGWHEDSDPLPPGYADYKSEFSKIGAEDN